MSEKPKSIEIHDNVTPVIHELKNLTVDKDFPPKKASIDPTGDATDNVATTKVESDDGADSWADGTTYDDEKIESPGDSDDQPKPVDPIIQRCREALTYRNYLQEQIDHLESRLMDLHDELNAVNNDLKTFNVNIDLL